MPRETPSARASSREDGSRSPARSRPPLIASRRLASSWVRSGWLAERSSRTSSSGLKPDHYIDMKSDLTSVPVGSYCPDYEHFDAGAARDPGQRTSPARQPAAGRDVPGRVHVADQLLPAAFGLADA